MRYNTVFIAVGLICLLLGQCFGVWMGVNQNFTLAPVHAHLNLAGGVLLCIYGLVHRAYPALAQTRLARIQAGAALIGAFAMPIGVAMAITTDNIVLGIVGSLLVLLGTLMFLIMFIGKAKAA